MSDRNLPTLIEDEHQISNLLMRWGHARDSEDWETLARCFHDDATIHLSWISGQSRDFVIQSRIIAETRHPDERAKHVIAGPWIQVNQNRAFSRCHANLYIRTTIEGQEFDLESWLRFFDLLERRNGIWRIVKRTAVYDKDRMDPVDPRGVPETFFAGMDLSAFPPSAKFLCYWLGRIGRPPLIDLVSAHSDEERAVKNEGDMWVENGGTSAPRLL